LYKEKGITVDENWDVPTLEKHDLAIEKEEVKDDWD
jgi:hypothetical protein